MSYAGDIPPEQAWQALASDPDAVLVDVRTHPELVFVGMPDLSSVGKRLVAVEWTSYPDGRPNAQFLDQLAANDVSTEAPVYFLCRSGARSSAAASAAAEAGWTQAYNVTEGFEGGLDDHGHRSVSGWKVAGLPWRQG